VIKIWKTSGKKNQTETQNTVEGHSSKLEQVEDRISELKDKLEIKEKTEEIKRPNLRIMSIKEGEEIQAKEICNIFNKVITENFPNLEKVLSN
jgi:TolA-binding protein